MTRRADLVISRKTSVTGKRPEGHQVSLGGSIAMDRHGVKALAAPLVPAGTGAGAVELCSGAGPERRAEDRGSTAGRGGRSEGAHRAPALARRVLRRAGPARSPAAGRGGGGRLRGPAGRGAGVGAGVVAGRRAPLGTCAGGDDAGAALHRAEAEWRSTGVRHPRRLGSGTRLAAGGVAPALGAAAAAAQ